MKKFLLCTVFVCCYAYAAEKNTLKIVYMDQEEICKSFPQNTSLRVQAQSRSDKNEQKPSTNNENKEKSCDGSDRDAKGVISAKIATAYTIANNSLPIQIVENGETSRISLEPTVGKPPRSMSIKK